MMSLLGDVYINSTLAFEQRPENSLLLKPSYAPANIPSPILLILVTATLTVVTQGASVTILFSLSLVSLCFHYGWPDPSKPQLAS